VARQLYAEDEASRRQRQQEVAERRLLASPGADLKGRPTKRARRQIHRFTHGD
jgi:ribosome-associated heat shock protein Hsp15